jgi:hypothetical protein
VRKGQTYAELPTCLTLDRSLVVSRAARLLGYRSYRDRSATSCHPHKVGWLVLGLRPAGTRGTWSDSKEVCAHHEVVGMSFAHADGTERSDRNGGAHP